MTGSRIRVLATAFAAVPGSSPHSAAMLSMVDALRADLDLVTVKTEELSHIKRMGEARMFRVPMGAATLAHQREIYTRAVGRQIEAEPYDVVHVFDPWAGVAAAARRRGFTLVYEIATFPDPDPDELELWLEAHEDTLAAADRVIVPTETARAVMATRGSTRVEVVAPGVDVGALDWAEVPRFGAARLLYLGPASPARDLDTALAAVARIAALRPVRALFAGEPDRARQQALRDRVDAAGLASVVEVRGEPSPQSVPGLIAAADVCLAPASGFLAAGLCELPQPLLEHLACYRPVVAANVPGVSEIVRDEAEGLLVPPGDPAALADAVLEILRDAVLRERLTDAGYRRARDELSAGAIDSYTCRMRRRRAPGSQLLDPWRDNFEEVTGLIELSTGLIEELQGPSTQQIPAAPAGEKVRPRPRRDDHPPTLDTQPGLVVPDTDPGDR